MTEPEHKQFLALAILDADFSKRVSATLRYEQAPTQALAILWKELLDYIKCYDHPPPIFVLRRRVHTSRHLYGEQGTAACYTLLDHMPSYMSETDAQAVREKYEQMVPYQASHMRTVNGARLPEQDEVTLRCKCGHSVMRKRDDGSEKVDARCVVAQAERVWAICRGCVETVDLPLTRTYAPASADVAAPAAEVAVHDDAFQCRLVATALVDREFGMRAVRAVKHEWFNSDALRWIWCAVGNHYCRHESPPTMDDLVCYLHSTSTHTERVKNAAAEYLQTLAKCAPRAVLLCTTEELEVFCQAQQVAQILMKYAGKLDKKCSKQLLSEFVAELSGLKINPVNGSRKQ